MITPHSLSEPESLLPSAKLPASLEELGGTLLTEGAPAGLHRMGWSFCHHHQDTAQGGTTAAGVPVYSVVCML